MNIKTSNNKTNVFTIVELPTSPKLRRTSLVQSGFTIVELLVVIVVIGILAAITIIAYRGISGKAIEASLESDLSSASKQLKLFQVTEPSGNYPTDNVCPSPGATEICLKASGDNYYTYTASNGTNPKTFTLDAINGTTVYRITNDSTPVDWPNWIAGIVGTALAGKYVRNADLGSSMQYQTTNTSIDSPQWGGGYDPSPGYTTNKILASPQTNPLVDFATEPNSYPAQNACKAIGGRLPNMQELLAIYADYADQATYGNNFQASLYWSSTEDNSTSASYVYFNGGYTGGGDKTYNLHVRCVTG